MKQLLLILCIVFFASCKAHRSVNCNANIATATTIIKDTVSNRFVKKFKEADSAFNDLYLNKK